MTRDYHKGERAEWEFDVLVETITEIVDDRRAEWRQAAACRGLDPEMFFAGRGENDTYESAIAVCATCPVVEECREHAVERDIRKGVWGGGSAHRLHVKGARLCRWCSARFTVERRGQVYCGEECSTEGRRAAHRRYNLRQAS